MKTWKRFLSMVLATGMVMGLAACGGGNNAATSGNANAGNTGTDGEKYVITVACTPSEESPEGAYAKAFKEYCEANSDGRLEVQLYLAAQMGTDREILESVQFNSVTMGGTGITQWTNFVTDLNVLDGPFVVTDKDTVYALFEDADFNQVLSEKFAQEGYHYMGEHFLGFREMTSNKEIKTMDDFKGIKIRVIENPTPIALWSALGCNPTPLAFTEVYTALQQGTVNAQENPVTNIYDKKFYEQQKYIVLTNHQIHTDFWAMNLDFYNSLPADLQEVVDAGSKAGIDAAHEYAETQADIQLKEMEDYGCTILTPDQALMDAMVSATQSVRDDIAAQYPEFSENVNAALTRIGG